jgi:hypothetical protein
METGPPIDAMVKEEAFIFGEDEGLLQEGGYAMQGDLLMDIPGVAVSDGERDPLAVQDSRVNALQGLR